MHDYYKRKMEEEEEMADLLFWLVVVGAVGACVWAGWAIWMFVKESMLY